VNTFNGGGGRYRNGEEHLPVFRIF
jgi:hypothetical protein